MMKSVGVKSGFFGSLRSVARVLCFVLLGYLFAACTASDPAKQAAKEAANPTHDDPSKGIICTYDVPTGSALKERKCTTPEQREQQRRETDHQIQVEPAIR